MPKAFLMCNLIKFFEMQLYLLMIFSSFSRSRHQKIGFLSTKVDSLMYNMKHPKRGKCLIINNRNFDPHLRLNERRGTEIDARSLHACFRQLDFDVSTYNDASAFEIKKVFEDGI